MPTETFVLDAVQYLIEPKDLFTARVPARLKARAPQVVAMPNGGEGWSYEQGIWLRPLGLDVAGGRSPLDIKDHGYTYGDLRQGMYDPRARLADMHMDGVDVALLFPTYALDVRNIKDPELHLACVQAYNDGVWVWCQAGDSKRLIPQALMPAAGPAEVLAELQRVAKHGFRGVVFSGFPSGGNGPNKDDEACFKFCEEAGLVLNLLRGGPIGGDRTPAAQPQYVGANATGVRVVEQSWDTLFAREAEIKNLNVAWLVLSGITERMPNLKVALVDAGAGWIRTTGELMDWNYRYMQQHMPTRLDYVPSDYLKRNFKATLRDERFVIIARHDFGDDYLMWSSSYPASSTSWPNSGRAIADALDGIPASEHAQILGRTAAQWYGLSVPAGVA